ncbi:hypothetical protein BRC81_15155 [Halobacteriales archaeon QS_1_68_20]|nr:MAG: hypothetical protein BRC81_15155 [Halobacteriales archaeon QS_1_68_20]
MTEDVRDLAQDLHDHLEATAERPLPTAANRWLGEAEAAARDAVGEDVPRPVIGKRAGQVSDLLSNVEETGDEVADQHVAAARIVAEEIQHRL